MNIPMYPRKWHNKHYRWLKGYKEKLGKPIKKETPEFLKMVKEFRKEFGTQFTDNAIYFRYRITQRSLSQGTAGRNGKIHKFTPRKQNCQKLLIKK